MNEAHFTINYYVNFKRRDKATISVSSWRSNSSIVVFLTLLMDWRIPIPIQIWQGKVIIKESELYKIKLKK